MLVRKTLLWRRERPPPPQELVPSTAAEPHLVRGEPVMTPECRHSGPSAPVSSTCTCSFNQRSSHFHRRRHFSRTASCSPADITFCCDLPPGAHHRPWLWMTVSLLEPEIVTHVTTVQSLLREVQAQPPSASPPPGSGGRRNGQRLPPRASRSSPGGYGKANSCLAAKQTQGSHVYCPSVGFTS